MREHDEDDEEYLAGYEDAWADLEMWYGVYDEGWDYYYYVIEDEDEYA